MTMNPLHQAIWNGHINMVLQCFHGKSQQDIHKLLEEVDAHGDTALLLALKCSGKSQHDVVKILLSAGADLHARDRDGWRCLHNGTLIDDDEVLAMMFMLSEKRAYEKLESKTSIVFKVLETLPDFYMEIKVEVKSWVPMVSEMLPSDILRIWKVGPRIRCDYTIKGLHGTKWKRGNMSQLLLKDNNNQGSIYLLDHDEKTVYDMSNSLLQPSLQDVETALNLLYTSPLNTAKIDGENVEFVKMKKLISRKTSKWGNICCYNMKNLNLNITIRGAIQKSWTRNGNTSKDERLEKTQKLVMKLRNKITDHIRLKKEDEMNQYRIAASQSLEMHLDLCCGDRVSWKFKTNSKFLEFSCIINAYASTFDVILANACGIVNKEISGNHQSDQKCKMILKWHNKNSKSRFNSSIALWYAVSHCRINHSDSLLNHPNASTLTDSDTNTANFQIGIQAKIVEIASEFKRLNHIPNPRSVSIPLDNYYSIDRTTKDKNTCDKGGVQDQFLDTTATSVEEKSPVGNIKSIGSIILHPEVQTVKKTLTARVTMCPEFPITVEKFISLLEFLSDTGEHTKNLKKFFNLKLPPGFPVEFEIPIGMSVKAAYSFKEFHQGPFDNVNLDYMQVPPNYTISLRKQ